MKNRWVGWVGGLALLSVGGYLLVSAMVFRIGFPLDDAWIHQTYARNLGLRGEWSFLPGVISAGSTAPLWTGLLAFGHLLRLGPYIWTYLCGLVGLVGLAWVGEATLRRKTGFVGRWPWLGAFLVMEWHLVWAAASGMETILFAALILLVFYLLSIDMPRWLLAGLVVGVATWVRPDGITLLGPIGLLAVMIPQIGLQKLVSALKALAGFGLAFLPYIGFNLVISGNLWPNTLYAKQAEYALNLQIPFLQRFGSLLALPLVGGGVLLLPGVIYAVWRMLRERQWFVGSLFLWWLGYNLIYSLILPLTYQHGRYLIPSMPAFFLLGGMGWVWLLQGHLRVEKGGPLKPLFSKRTRRLLRLSWMMGILLVTLAFWGLGAVTYAQDVAIIETEMVDTAHWLSENIPNGARVAVHDIGAIGYFAQVDILDTAGLISPQVIPFIRDEAHLAEYLNQQDVAYLVTFPEWYPKLVGRATLIHQTQGKFSPAAGGENMAVYRWQR